MGLGSSFYVFQDSLTNWVTSVYEMGLAALRRR